ncbi:MAG: glycosyltransferase family 39 protein [Planctomycetota bacterium]|jgi:predicted membrane-bound dolichyl-phosphate-mannose-protein mannosyltransferase
MSSHQEPLLSTGKGLEPERVKQLSIRHFLPLAGIALIVRLILAPWFCHSGDMGTFMAWGYRLADIGLGNFYPADPKEYFCDYLPGYFYVLWPLGELAKILPASLQILIFKLPNMCTDLAAAYLIWRLLKPNEQNNKLWVPAIYLFNPAVFINSTLWGQVDSFHAFCILAALALLVKHRPLSSAVVLGLSIAVKPHAVVMLPLAAIYAVKNRIGWFNIIVALLIVCAVFVATFLPFNHWDIPSLPKFIKGRIDTTMGQYGFSSVNALNLWYLAGQNFKYDSTSFIGPINIQLTGTLLFALSYAVALAWYWHRSLRYGSRAFWESASIVFLATFLFLTRVHERHLFGFFPLILLVVGMGRGALVPYAIYSATYLINMILSWAWLNPTFETDHICHPALSAVLCISNLALLPLSMIMYTQTGDRFVADIQPWFAQRLITKLQPDPIWIIKNRAVLLGAIILFTLATRVIRLNAPPIGYHDEVYHAYTAEQWVKSNSDAWLWDTTTPPGLDWADNYTHKPTYEWTHPPLAKLLMQTSMEIFGIRPWAWRLPAALLGTLCAVMIYGIAKTLFKRESIALLAATLYALDALPLVMSRVGMNDIYLLTFVLAAFLAALLHRYYLSALCVGAALACKWSALYALPLLALIYLLRPHPKYGLKIRYLAGLTAVHIVAVVAVYLASYLPFFKAGHSVKQFGELQKQMWYYHTGLTATHSGSSKAWQWPINRKIMWFYTSKSDDPKANIHALGNPIIWFAGLLAVIFSGYLVIRERHPSLILILAGYLCFWAPWLFSPRIMFINHYLPSLPFLYIALAAAVASLKFNRVHILCLLIISALTFLVIYSYITACYLPPYLAPDNIMEIISGIMRKLAQILL